jgi:hypothetical protein
MALAFAGLLLKSWPSVWVGVLIVALCLLEWLWPRRQLREREPPPPPLSTPAVDGGLPQEPAHG